MTGVPMCVSKDAALLPAVMVMAGWEIEVEHRWFTVFGDPRHDGDQVQLWFRGPGVPVLDTAIFGCSERVWARAPQPGALETLGCINPDCGNDGPYVMTDKGLMCEGCVTDHALAETAGPDTDEEMADRG